MKITDIHSHTYFSACGADKHEDIIEAAINGGIEVFGICDHCYGIGERRREYCDIITEMKRKYEGKIKLLCGIEIATVPNLGLYDPEDLLPEFEYCLIEHIDRDNTTVGEGIFEYAKRFNCKTGIAHTDLISMARNRGYDPVEFLHRFAENDIFWEMNVNYDSIHGFNEHAYVRSFFTDEETQNIVRSSGIKLTVGFDGHRVYDYAPERVRTMNKFIFDNGFNFQEF